MFSFFVNPADYSYWKTGDFRMQPENGNLPQRWASIPLLFTNTQFPKLDQQCWRESRVGDFGEEFFYRIGNAADAMLFRARAMMGLFGVALGALVYFWTRRLLGAGPALLSLVLFSFCPTMLANGSLVTSDMAAAFFFCASMYCVWIVLHRISFWTVLASCSAISGLFLSKFSAFLIVPMGLLLVIVRLLSADPLNVRIGSLSTRVFERGRRLLMYLVLAIGHAAVVWLAIWAFYDFRFNIAIPNRNASAENDSENIFRKQWDEVTKQPDSVIKAILKLRDAHILPEAYLYGFAFTWHHAQERSAFLNGKYSRHGFIEFFPYCLSVKTPLTLFVLIVLSLVWLMGQWRTSVANLRGQFSAVFDSLYHTAPLWIMFMVYWISAITSHLNIGHRHILPTYPAMLILAGNAWNWVASAWRLRRVSKTSKLSNAMRSSLLGVIVLASAALFAGESLYRWPNYLAYFNQLVGGPWYGYQHLVDSSLDWGQDLPALKEWLEQNGLNGASDGTSYFSYFGNGNPVYYGIRAKPLPSYFERTPAHLPEPLQPGTYCFSATMFQSVYLVCRGPWNSDYESHYRTLANKVRSFLTSTPEARARMLASEDKATWITIFNHYEQARLARLTSYLRQREPDAEVNYSILIYHLDKTDLTRALDGPPTELDNSFNPED